MLLDPLCAFTSLADAASPATALSSLLDAVDDESGNFADADPLLDPPGGDPSELEAEPDTGCTKSEPYEDAST